MAKVLVIGSGGREHALCQQFQHSPQVDTVYCAPGNAGMRRDAIQLVAIDELDFMALITFAQENAIDLTFVGPEVPLSAGIVDAFRAQNLPIFGPTQAVAQLESSKAFAKAFMKQHQIPTADYAVFTQQAPAQAYCRQHAFPLVIKVDDLAAGKGVTVVPTLAVAERQLATLYRENPQRRIVVEDYLEGVEVSFMCLVHGDIVVPFPLSRDHKRLLSGNRGPNTGGMGAFSPIRDLPAQFVDDVMATIIQPTIQGMATQGHPITGVIYAGLMVTASGINVIEYNLRLGDPETQVLLPRLQSDFYQIIQTLLHDQQPQVQWQSEGVTLGVVVAAPGYPTQPQLGIPLSPTLTSTAEVTVTFAGVEQATTGLISHGGRIWMATTTQLTLSACRQVITEFLVHHAQSPLIYRDDIGLTN